jgi:hypothetical protein
LTICGTRACGVDGACPSCGTLSLGGGVTVSGAPFSGYLTSFVGLGSSLELCGLVPFGEYDVRQCISWALSGASAYGGLGGSLVTAMTGNGSTIELGGYAPCGFGESEYDCLTSGRLDLTCAP